MIQELNETHSERMKLLDKKVDNLKDKLEDDLLQCECEIKKIQSKIKKIKLKCKDDIINVESERKYFETIYNISLNSIKTGNLIEPDSD